MSEKKEMTTDVYKENQEEAQKNLYKTFIPSVHRIGRSTMAIALVLAFLPVLYFFFVKGYRESLSSYLSVAIAIASPCLGMWLTEPLAYWPVLGSAGTYMGYLAGSVSGMRFPVAMNLQSSMDADINSAKGQIVTIVGIVASVFANLALLAIFVLGGDLVVSILPKVVLASFSFVLVGIFGSLLFMHWNGKQGLVKGFMDSLPYLVLAVVSRLIMNQIPALQNWTLALSVVFCVILSYFFYRQDCKKDAEAAEN